MADEQVERNTKGMDDLDFDGWNKGDWNGVFAAHHTSDVLGLAFFPDNATARCPTNMTLSRVELRAPAGEPVSYATPSRRQCPASQAESVCNRRGQVLILADGAT